MTEADRYKITSNDFIDLIVEWNQDMSAFDRYPNASIHIINERYAIVYIPAAQFTSRYIMQYGYSVIPACFATESAISLEASGLTRLRRLPNLDLLGKGVLIGIIDTGIDYTNPVFRNRDGTTKIISLWDQTIESNNFPKQEGYGTEYSAEQINAALQSDNPFEVVPSKDEDGHGTMLAGIAAGSEDVANNFSGVAPESDLIVVKLKPAKPNIMNFYAISPDVLCYMENDIMWGFHYIFETARALRRPVAVCIGLGSNNGAHDGYGSLSAMLSIGGDSPGTVVVVSAGNEGNTRRHFFSEIDPAIGSTEMEINVADNEYGFTLEIWGRAPDTYSIDILSPTGEYIPRIPERLRVTREIGFVFEKTTMNLDYQMVETSTGDELILLRFRNPTAGIWTIRIYIRGDFPGSVNAWLPSTGFISDNTYFVRSDPYTTITSPGSSLVPITVTAYSPENNNLYQRSSKGYSRIGTIKPELAAPGVNILAPDLNHGFIQVTGTGAAAAHTTGAAALILEWGIIDGNYLGIDTVEVKTFMVRGATTNPNLVYPNRDWGYGILNVYNIFEVLRIVRP